MQETAYLSIKVILIGDPNVGKTSLITRWALEIFDESEKRDALADQVSKKVIINDTCVELAMYDTAGQERFRTLTGSFFRGAHVAILVFDVSDSTSFEHIDRWIDDLKRYSLPLKVFLVGNKTDLKSERTVTYEAAQEKIEQTDFLVLYMETSAKADDGVDELFSQVAKIMLETASDLPRPRTDTLTISSKSDTLNMTATEKKKCCK
eukprot:TRINITY_DN406_c0_g1_i3.p1 TRINITY_DN406_c0_g1~~TRINITY_DN406_c0_g1_i3.p1  ORF type:complete len:207 (+),score=39.31 TRINITY_DN406_c0_g1_i3:91-711(+)